MELDCASLKLSAPIGCKLATLTLAGEQDNSKLGYAVSGKGRIAHSLWPRVPVGEALQRTTQGLSSTEADHNGARFALSTIGRRGLFSGEADKLAYAYDVHDASSMTASDSARDLKFSAPFAKNGGKTRMAASRRKMNYRSKPATTAIKLLGYFHCHQKPCSVFKGN